MVESRNCMCGSKNEFKIQTFRNWYLSVCRCVHCANCVHYSVNSNFSRMILSQCHILEWRFSFSLSLAMTADATLLLLLLQFVVGFFFYFHILFARFSTSITFFYPLNYYCYTTFLHTSFVSKWKRILINKNSRKKTILKDKTWKSAYKPYRR